MNVWERKVKIRKNHICYGCNETIQKGSIAIHNTIVDDGFSSCYFCLICHNVRTFICSPMDFEEMFQGDVKEWYPDQWQEYASKQP